MEIKKIMGKHDQRWGTFGRGSWTNGKYVKRKLFKIGGSNFSLKQ